MSEHTNDELAQENAELRATLERSNAELRQAVADAQSAVPGSGGLTNEDVRRLEHPDEFAGEAQAAAAEEDEEPAQLAPVAPAATEPGEILYPPGTVPRAEFERDRADAERRAATFGGGGEL